MNALRLRAVGFLRDLWTLYFICRDPRLPAAAKAMAVALVVYALSPIDLLPDVLPALGILDDLLVIPAGLFIIQQLIPGTSLAEHRARADRALARMSVIVVALLIVAMWTAALGVAAIYLL